MRVEALWTRIVGTARKLSQAPTNLCNLKCSPSPPPDRFKIISLPLHFPVAYTQISVYRMCIGPDGRKRASADQGRRQEMAYIAIEWTYGRPRTGADQDEARASAAAEAVLDAAGVNYAEAEAEYQRQWLEFDDEGPMTGLALSWIAATKAADLALTEGWHNTDGASCSIVAG